MEEAGNRILSLVSERRFEEALGVSLDATRQEVNRAHVRLLHRHRSRPLVREALNRAKSAMASETDRDRGRRLVEMGRHHEALTFLERAATRDPCAEALNALGRVLYRLARHEQALSHLGRAMELRGSLVDRLWLGRTLDAMGRSEEALDHFIVLVQERGAASDHHLVGVTLFGLQRYDEALVHLERAAALGDDPMDHELCAMCLERRRDSRPPGIVERITGFFQGIAGSKDPL